MIRRALVVIESKNARCVEKKSARHSKSGMSASKESAQSSEWKERLAWAYYVLRDHLHALSKNHGIDDTACRSIKAHLRQAGDMLQRHNQKNPVAARHIERAANIIRRVDGNCCVNSENKNCQNAAREAETELRNVAEEILGEQELKDKIESFKSRIPTEKTKTLISEILRNHDNFNKTSQAEKNYIESARALGLLFDV